VADEHDIPVKVVDRRWWANSDAAGDREAAGGASLKPTYVEELERQVADKDRLIQEYIGKYRQATSEFEEARLRLRREIAKDVERARREVLAELLEVVDNLDRAVDAAGPTASLESVVQGIEMVRRQFIAKLEALGVSRVDATGQPFDPQVHEAVTTVPAASPEEDGIVMGVIRHGYRMGDDVLRPASVAVGRR
jgi:molecular chaperone GrpE (heat shock protein)